MPRITHPETTITRPHQRLMLKPTFPWACCPEEIKPARTSVTPKIRTMAAM